jgi:hypothetical protein
MCFIIIKETKRWVSESEWEKKENKANSEWVRLSEKETKKKTRNSAMKNLNPKCLDDIHDNVQESWTLS